MAQIKALHTRLPRELRGRLNLIYLNALAELHNHGAQLGCDYRSLTPQERTAFVRRVGHETLRNRRFIRVGDRPGAAADVVGAAVLPHMAALELIDWLEQLRALLPQEKLPILLKQDRESEVFTSLLREIEDFYPETEFIPA